MKFQTGVGDVEQSLEPERRRRNPAPLVLTIALTIHAVIGIRSLIDSPRPAGDFDRYYEIASSPGRPYVDYQVEHPIATLLLFKLIARPDGRATFGVGVVALNLLADALIVASLIRGWGVDAAAFYAVILIPVLGLFFNRIDAWSTAAAAIAVQSWQRGRPFSHGVALAVGGALKLWPLVLAPLALLHRRRWESLAAFGLAAAVLGGSALWLAGTSSVLEVLTFRGARGWQIESVVGSLIHLRSADTPRLESGSWRIGTTNGFVGIAMFLAAAPLCLWSSWRGVRTRRIGTGWLAAVSALLLLSALLSAQYVIWLTPGAAIAWTEGDRRSAGLAALAVFSTQVFWTFYGSVLAGGTAVLLVVVFRNLVLLLLLVSASARLREGLVTPDRESLTGWS